ncbi:MAG TPA: VOC family protein [Acidimicrobiia bacterium]|jgi:catechol 2,3-dioxygenase-like lactoylglutathione lyase family enzyme
MLSDYPVGAALAVSDLSRARAFYEDVLGFTPAEIRPETEEVAYRAGEGTWFFVYVTASAGTNQATAAAFRVADLDATVAELRSRGVRFAEYDLPGLKTVDSIAIQADGTRVAWFPDPDGNVIGLDQLPA